MAEINPFAGWNEVSLNPFENGNWVEMSPDQYAQEAQAHADSFTGKFEDFFGGGNSARAAAARTAADRAYEQQATNSARQWDLYMQSTYYQRMVEDLKKAGLNPWLAVNGGIGNTVNYSSAGSGSSARYKTEEKSKSSAATLIAGFMIAAARVIAALV